jgi:hypothetical protein
MRKMMSSANQVPYIMIKFGIDEKSHQSCISRNTYISVQHHIPNYFLLPHKWPHVKKHSDAVMLYKLIRKLFLQHGIILTQHHFHSPQRAEKGRHETLLDQL